MANKGRYQYNINSGAYDAGKKVHETDSYILYEVPQEKNEEVDNTEFKKLVLKSLSSTGVTSNPKMEKIVNLWKQVDSMTYSKEDALIKELQDNNREKFDTLTDIVNTEIIKRTRPVPKPGMDPNNFN